MIATTCAHWTSRRERLGMSLINCECPICRVQVEPGVPNLSITGQGGVFRTRLATVVFEGTFKLLHSRYLQASIKKNREHADDFNFRANHVLRNSICAEVRFLIQILGLSFRWSDILTVWIFHLHFVAAKTFVKEISNFLFAVVGSFCVGVDYFSGKKVRYGITSRRIISEIARSVLSSRSQLLCMRDLSSALLLRSIVILPTDCTEFKATFPCYCSHKKGSHGKSDQRGIVKCKERKFLTGDSIGGAAFQALFFTRRELWWETRARRLTPASLPRLHKVSWRCALRIWSLSLFGTERTSVVFTSASRKTLAHRSVRIVFDAVKVRGHTFWLTSIRHVDSNLLEGIGM